MFTLLYPPREACLGLDISQAKIDAALLRTGATFHAPFANSRAGLKQLQAWCRRHGVTTTLAVLEATGSYGELAATELHAAGWSVHLANARRIKDYARSLGRRNKTDRLDAELIAGFGATRQLPLWQPPSPAQQRLRSLLRRLHDLQTMLQAERNRCAACHDPLVSQSLTRIVRTLHKEGTALEAQLRAHLQSAPALHADVQRLCQIEGIGLRSAAWICAELPRHLPNARAAAAWLGVTPQIRQSGTALHRTAPVGAQANRHLRKVLFMAAMVARRHNPRLKTFADRLAANGKSKMAVLIAVLHKLIKISFALLQNQSTYNPLHNPLAPPKN